MPCMDEESVIRLVQGSALGDTERAAYVQHLGGCDACRELVAETAKSIDATIPDATVLAQAKPPHAPEIGETTLHAPGELFAGRYRLEETLGSGGGGYVLGGVHEGLRTPVAIKLLHARLLSNSDLVSRMLREARAAARVTSDHVVRVLDVGALPSGEPYIVMERLHGMDLAQHLQARGKFSVGEAVTLVLQACEALAHAHRAGIVHRDLKPANLFLSERAGGEPIVKVLDFGISKVERRSTQSEHDFTTQQQTWLGTPRYMAPEQITLGRKVDARTDIWALGVVLHELVAGVHPFPGPDLEAVLRSVLDEDVASLEATGAPRKLARIVKRCLEKAPADRFANVGELARALAPFADKPSEALVDSIEALTVGPDSVPSRRSPIRLWMVLVAIPIIVLTFGFFGWALGHQRDGSEPPPTVAGAGAAVAPLVVDAPAPSVSPSEPASAELPAAVATTPARPARPSARGSAPPRPKDSAAHPEFGRRL